MFAFLIHGMRTVIWFLPILLIVACSAPPTFHGMKPKVAPDEESLPSADATGSVTEATAGNGTAAARRVPESSADPVDSLVSGGTIDVATDVTGSEPQDPVHDQGPQSGSDPDGENEPPLSNDLDIDVSGDDAGHDTDGLSNDTDSDTSAPDEPTSSPSKPEPNSKPGPMPEPKMKTHEMTFHSHIVQSSQVEFALGEPYVHQQLTLQRQYSAKTKEYEQSERPRVTDHFDQGHEGIDFDETFVQKPDKLLDILIVVDDSSSMEQEQENLSTKLLPLLSYVSDTDWQVGVVTTNPDDTCLRALIKKSDSNAEGNFAAAIQAGVAGNDNERGILTSVRSISGTCLETSWIRDRSTLAILFVSDEDNCSDGSKCPGKDYQKSDYLYDYLAQIREPGQNAKVYGLIWHPSQDASECSTALNQANIYADVIDRTGGAWGSICDDDYTETLEAISQSIADVVQNIFTLRYDPEAGTTQVLVDGVEVTSGFTITGNVLKFDSPLAEGSVVSVTYKHDAIPITTRFTLQFGPYANSESVTVNGLPVDKSEYIFDGQTIVFNEAPPALARVKVNYVRDVTLNGEFYLWDDKIRPGSVKVFIDDLQTTALMVDYDRAVVTFDQPPPEHAMIRIEYQQLGDPILEYPVSLDYDIPENFAAFDSVTGDDVQISFDSGSLFIDESEWAEGRELTVRFENLERDSFQVELPNDPIAGTVRLVGGTTDCDTSPYLEVSGNMVLVDHCEFSDDVDDVIVHYDFVVEEHREFVFDEIEVPDEDAHQVWKVWVNDMPFQDYSRVGNIIRIDEPLDIGSKIRVQLKYNEAP